MSKRNTTYPTDIELHHHDDTFIDWVAVYFVAAFAFVIGFFAGVGL